MRLSLKYVIVKDVRCHLIELEAICGAKQRYFWWCCQPQVKQHAMHTFISDLQRAKALAKQSVQSSRQPLNLIGYVLEHVRRAASLHLVVSLSAPELPTQGQIASPLTALIPRLLPQIRTKITANTFQCFVDTLSLIRGLKWGLQTTGHVLQFGPLLNINILLIGK